MSKPMDTITEELEIMQEDIAEIAERLIELEKNAKQQTSASFSTTDKSTQEIAQSILSGVEEMIESRMGPLEQKVEGLALQYQELEEKLDWLGGHMEEWGLTRPCNKDNASSVPIVELAAASSAHKLHIPNVRRQSDNFVNGVESEDEQLPSQSDGGPRGTLNGVWLGDPENPDQRVQVQISQEELDEINASCPTMREMALNLLDLLFDRETQACSNLSGKGRLKKKQLDPIKIEAIRFHLIFMFNMTEQEWKEVQPKLDSKCQAAFQRKKDGLPMTTVKTFKKSPRTVRKRAEEPLKHEEHSEDDDD